MAGSSTISNVLAKCASEAERASTDYQRGASLDEAAGSIRNAPDEAVHEFLAEAERKRNIAPQVLAQIIDQSNRPQNFRLTRATVPMVGQVIRRVIFDEPDASDKEERKRRELLFKGGENAGKFFKLAEQIVTAGKLPAPMVTTTHQAMPGLLGHGGLIVTLVSVACLIAIRTQILRDRRPRP